MMLLLKCRVTFASLDNKHGGEGNDLSVYHQVNGLKIVLYLHKGILFSNKNEQLKHTKSK